MLHVGFCRFLCSRMVQEIAVQWQGESTAEPMGCDSVGRLFYVRRLA